VSGRRGSRLVPSRWRDAALVGRPLTLVREMPRRAWAFSAGGDGSGRSATPPGSRRVRAGDPGASSHTCPCVRALPTGPPPPQKHQPVFQTKKNPVCTVHCGRTLFKHLSFYYPLNWLEFYCPLSSSVSASMRSARLHGTGHGFTAPAKKQLALDTLHARVLATQGTRARVS